MVYATDPQDVPANAKIRNFDVNCYEGSYPTNIIEDRCFDFQDFKISKKDIFEKKNSKKNCKGTLGFIALNGFKGGQSST